MSIDLEYDRRSTDLAYKNPVRCTTLYFTRLGRKQADAPEQGRRIVELAVDRFAAIAPEEIAVSLDRLAVSLAMEEKSPGHETGLHGDSAGGSAADATVASQPLGRTAAVG